MTLRTLIIPLFMSLAGGAMFASFCAAQGRNPMQQGGQGGMGQSAFGLSGQGGGGQGVGRGQSRAGGQGGFGASGGFGSGSTGGGAFGGMGQGGTNQLATGQNGFIGSNSDQVQDLFRNRRGAQGRTAMFDFMIENLNEMRDRGGRGGGDNRTPPVRVKLRPAFETPLGTMQQVNSDVQTRLSSSLNDLGVTDTRIAMEGRTLTLEGTVASDHHKALVEKMISLEPGVSTIENRLTVDPSLEQEE